MPDPWFIILPVATFRGLRDERRASAAALAGLSLEEAEAAVAQDDPLVVATVSSADSSRRFVLLKTATQLAIEVARPADLRNHLLLLIPWSFFALMAAVSWNEGTENHVLYAAVATTTGAMLPLFSAWDVVRSRRILAESSRAAARRAVSSGVPDDARPVVKIARLARAADASEPGSAAWVEAVLAVASAHTANGRPDLAAQLTGIARAGRPADPAVQRVQAEIAALRLPVATGREPQARHGGPWRLGGQLVLPIKGLPTWPARCPLCDEPAVASRAVEFKGKSAPTVLPFLLFGIIGVLLANRKFRSVKTSLPVCAAHNVQAQVAKLLLVQESDDYLAFSGASATYLEALPPFGTLGAAPAPATTNPFAP